ncbi:MAG: hypothetical protein AVDCRST_MAG70-1610, partial [uncultured Thermomicrobiales bacterium]
DLPVLRQGAPGAAASLRLLPGLLPVRVPLDCRRPPRRDPHDLYPPDRGTRRPGAGPCPTL